MPSLSPMRATPVLAALVAVLLAAVLFGTPGSAAQLKFGPEAWVQGPSCGSAGAGVRLLLALRHGNDQRLTEAAQAVSSPGHAEYGRFWSQQAVAELTAAAPRHLQAVREWLAPLLGDRLDERVRLTRARDAVSVALTCEEAERAFGSPFALFEHSAGLRRPVVRLARAHAQAGRAHPVRDYLPDALHEGVVAVVGLADFPAARPSAAAAHRAAWLERVRASPAPGKVAAAPNLLAIQAFHEQLLLEVQPGCQDGTYPNRTAAPFCAGGVDLESLVVRAAQGGATFDGSVPASAMHCRFTPSGAVVCLAVATVPGLADYEKATVKVSAAFSDGSSSDWSDTALKATPIPMVTPDVVLEQYGVPRGLRAAPDTDVTQSVVSFAGQYYSPDDLHEFLWANGLPHANMEVWGKNNASSEGGEAALDVTCINGVARGFKTVFWSMTDVGTPQPGSALGGFNWLLDWLLDAADRETVPDTVSVSYGLPLRDQLGVPGGEDYIARCETEFKKLALRGVTVVVASGDDGVADSTDPEHCADSELFHVDYPAASPWVTAVGSSVRTTKALGVYSGGVITHFEELHAEVVHEAGCVRDFGCFFDTGGGFNWHMPRPWYQPDSQVMPYFAQHGINESIPAGAVNASGRALPEVVLLGQNVATVQGGVIEASGGTSASAPMFAGMVTLWNELRRRAGLPRIGHAAPALWTLARLYPETFNDVVAGENKCTRNATLCCERGLTAAPGWDPVGGLGSPRFQRLADLLVSGAAFPGEGDASPGGDTSYADLGLPAVATAGPRGAAGPAGPAGPAGRMGAQGTSGSGVGALFSALLFVSLAMNVAVAAYLFLQSRKRQEPQRRQGVTFNELAEPML